MHRRSFWAIGVCLLAACGSRAKQAPPVTVEPPPVEVESEGVPQLRLPEDTRPLRYHLSLRIDPAKPRFTGEVRIDVQLSATRRTLWLHGQNLHVERARVREGDDGQWVVAEYEEVGPDGLSALRLPTPLGAGKLQIEIVYDAPFGEKLRGLYRVREGRDVYAFTQFEPLSARETFPCFDEPRFKTPFEVRLVVPKGQVAIANTLQQRAAPVGEGAYVEHVYAPTQPLPTYLLAFAVGPLEVVEAPPIAPTEVRERPLPFRGVAVRGRGDELDFALQRTPAMVQWLERYFDTPYPYDKLDVIAVPDFGAGAMENAGAITFREVFLLLDEDASQQQRHGFAEVMAHELAHQWFGNLVTMPFWEDLWLNEAFATWMATHVVDELYPDYHAELEQLRHTHHAMGIDEKRSARAIRQPIESSHDIYNAFDGITYSKGGAVLAMFEGYIGEEAFREGLRRYMREHAFGSATAEDLVAALSQAADQDLRDAFFSFLTQPGVPNVEVSLECEDDAVRVHMRQGRYVPLGGQPDPDALWELPVCMRYASEDGQPTSECLWLREREQAASLKAAACPVWVMPNAGAHGYYRWSLPSESLSALAQRGWSELSDAERQSTAESFVASLRAGSASPERIYAALLRLAEDGDRHVSATALAPLAFANDYLLDEKGQASYRVRIRQVLEPRVERLGLVPRPEKDSGEVALLRRTLVTALCLEARDATCRRVYGRAGRASLGLSVARAPTLTADLRGLALTVALQDGDAKVFEAAVARLTETQDAVERSRLLWAIGSVTDPELAERARALSLDPRLKVNEVITPLWAQSRLPERRAANWQWVLAHMNALQSRLPGRRAGQLVDLASGFCSEERAQAVRTQFAEHARQLVGAPRELASTVEGIRLCAARAEALREPAQAFFATGS